VYATRKILLVITTFLQTSQSCPQMIQSLMPDKTWQLRYGWMVQ
jgi:hypothetical protein